MHQPSNAPESLDRLPQRSPSRPTTEAAGAPPQRPSHSQTRRTLGIPSQYQEHAETFRETTRSIRKAAINILGSDELRAIAYEVLQAGVEVAEFVPIAGLAGVARTLLSIWQAMCLVNRNRKSCLGLAERSAETLMTIRREIASAGLGLGDSELSRDSLLQLPVQLLTNAIQKVQMFVKEQLGLGFIKRYLGRETIQEAIKDCDTSLSGAVSMFSVSVQVRQLKDIRATQQKVEEGVTAILDSIDRHFRAFAFPHPRPTDAGQSSGLPLPSESTESHAIPEPQAVTAYDSNTVGNSSMLISAHSAIGTGMDAQYVKFVNSSSGSVGREAVEVFWRALKEDIQETLEKYR